MSKLPVRNMKGEVLPEMDFAEDLLVSGKGTQAVHDSVVAYRAAQRAGTAATKRRDDVSGGGRKPYKQKGTGRARAGSIRSPIWRGGGTIFGPQPRDYTKKVNKKTGQLAFRNVFGAKVVAGEITVLDQLVLTEPKTRLLSAMLKKLGVSKGLLVIDKMEKSFLLAARNLEGLEMTTAASVNTYQLLRYSSVLISREAMVELERRLRNQVG